MMHWVMANAGLTIWPTVALVIFFATFVGLVFHIFQRSRDEEYAAAARLPFDDERESHD